MKLHNKKKKDSNNVYYIYKSTLPAEQKRLNPINTQITLPQQKHKQNVTNRSISQQCLNSKLNLTQYK